MIGETILHYDITAKLGEGGMGEVYLAEDTKLHRKVALKFLPDSLQKDPEARERLLREARAASQLNHPNILTVHAVETADGRDFIVMEFLEGTNLDQYCEEKQPSIATALSIGIGIAAGLERAHRAGIVHRDLKPGNIMVDSEDTPKVLDFGVAKFEGSAKLTQTGSTVGTMAYMSPEQAQSMEVDHRSDLFSFGVILYEMITGKTPFKGIHEAGIIYSIVNEEPEPLARYKSQVPDELQRIISKCLSKFPDARYQSAADLMTDLQSLSKTLSSGTFPTQPQKTSRVPWIAASIAFGLMVIVAVLAWGPFGSGPEEVEASRKMLAVLPFENLGSPDDEYFADGVTEELTARLAGIAGLGVIARTSVIQYKGSDQPIQKIGEELGVDYILEGTIRWQKSADGADRVRITPQLISVSDATHLWAEVYDEVITEVFEVQSDVAQKVVAALNVTLMDPEREALEHRPTDNIKAYDYHLRGNQYWSVVVSGTISNSVYLAKQQYEKAIEADSDFALAYAQLSRIHTELYWHAGQNEEDRIMARKLIDRAFELNPELPENHVSLGSLYYHGYEYEKALKEFDVALKKQPNNAEILIEISFVHVRQAQYDEAIEAVRKAAVLDPRSAVVQGQVCAYLTLTRQYDSALTYINRAQQLAPQIGAIYTDKAMVLIHRDGDLDGALATLRDGERLAEPSSVFYQDGGLIYLFSRDYTKAVEYLSHGNPSVPAMHYCEIARIHRIQGNDHLAQIYFDSARVLSEQLIKDGHDNAGTYSTLGMALAGLGQYGEAIQAGKDAINKRPVPGDSKTNPNRITNLAWIYMAAGHDDEAIDQLERVTSMPSWTSPHSIRLNPIWDPLRDNPRFKALIEPKSPTS